MLTKADVVANLKLNLDDPRMHGICLFIDKLIRRENPEPTITAYRVMNKDTNTLVNSFSEFVSGINAAGISMSYPFGVVQLTTDRVTGYNVVVDNLHLNFNPRAKDDEVFDEMFGFHSNPTRPYKFSFHMAYLNDADAALEVKICNVRLIQD